MFSSRSTCFGALTAGWLSRRYAPHKHNTHKRQPRMREHSDLMMVSSTYCRPLACLFTGQPLACLFTPRGPQVLLAGPNLLRTFALGTIGILSIGTFLYMYFSTQLNENDACHSYVQCTAINLLTHLNGDASRVVGNQHGHFAFPALEPGYDMWGSFRSFIVFISIIFWVFLLQGIIQGQVGTSPPCRARRSPQPVDALPTPSHCCHSAPHHAPPLAQAEATATTVLGSS